MYPCCSTPFIHHVNPAVLHCTYTSIVISTTSYYVSRCVLLNSKTPVIHRVVNYIYYTDLNSFFVVFPYWVPWQAMEPGRKHCQGSRTESSVLVGNLNPSEEGRACCEGQLDAFTFCQAYVWVGLKHSAFHFQIKSTWSWSKHFYIFSGRSNKMINTVIDKILRNKS